MPGELGELGGFVLGQLGVVGQVPVRADQHVAAVVGVEVEYRVDQRTPGDDQRFLVAQGGRTAERAALVLART
jgi:hypothetical protein